MTFQPGGAGSSAKLRLGRNYMGDDQAQASSRRALYACFTNCVVSELNDKKCWPGTYDSFDPELVAAREHARSWVPRAEHDQGVSAEREAPHKTCSAPVAIQFGCNRPSTVTTVPTFTLAHVSSSTSTVPFSTCARPGIGESRRLDGRVIPFCRQGQPPSKENHERADRR